jgi:hypothetical protein
VLVTTVFTVDGAPETGLSPLVTIRRVDTGAVVINQAAMTEVGGGWYKYDFATYDADLDYAINCDGGASLQDEERYTFGTNDHYKDDIADQVWDELVADHTDVGSTSDELAEIRTKTDNLPDDPADQSLVEAAITTSETNIRGADSDDLKVLSDQMDVVQILSEEIQGPTFVDENLVGIDGKLDLIVASIDIGPGVGSITINGNVINSETQEPLENLLIRALDGTTRVALVSTRSNANGDWTLYLDPGTYYFEFSGEGFQETELLRVVPDSSPQDFDNLLPP